MQYSTFNEDASIELRGKDEFRTSLRLKWDSFDRVLRIRRPDGEAIELRLLGDSSFEVRGQVPDRCSICGLMDIGEGHPAHRPDCKRNKS